MDSDARRVTARQGGVMRAKNAVIMWRRSVRLLWADYILGHQGSTVASFARPRCTDLPFFCWVD